MEFMRPRPTLNFAGGVIAVAAVVALGLRANLRFDDSWDGTAYHLVFAAFRSGILTLDDLTPIPLIRDLYRGFPPLLDIIRGYTWRITGSILILQNFGLLAVLALTGFWKFNFNLPARWTILAVLSVPLLQIGATTLYVDTFVNCFFAIPLSALTAAFIERRALRRNEAMICLIALAVAANTKLQFVALGFLLLIVLCAYQTLHLVRDKQKRDAWLFIAFAAAASFAVLFTAWRNLIEFGNPLYPMAIAVLGHTLPGTLPTSVWSGPLYLDGRPELVKWLLSVLEFRAFEGRDLMYTIDQHSLIPIGVMPGPDTMRPRPPSFRMGGYFAPLVLGLIAALAISTKDFPPRQRLRWFAAPIVTSVIVAVLPAAHELRYFSFWMLNLIFLCFLAARDASRQHTAFHAFILAVFLSVGMWTGWRYFDFKPYSVQDHIAANGIDRAITGEDICFEHRNRDPILFTYIFHSHGKYRVVDLAPGERCP
jgi:hypothetical protein